MHLSQFQRQFVTKYYNWACHDFEREINQEFPFLKTFKSGSCWHVLAMMLEMPQPDRFIFARALLKRFHRDAIRILGEQITAHDNELCEKYFERAALTPNPVEIALEMRTRSGERDGYADRKELRKIIRKELDAADIGISYGNSAIWHYVKPVGHWKIVTEIDTSNKFSQIIYHHDIIVPTKSVCPNEVPTTDQFVHLARLISFNAWLGISSTTSWSDLTNTDCPDAARNLARLCQHFLRCVHKLLENQLEYGL